ncbi:FtsX-like permease family protein [Paenibacillus sp. SYP-B4298]|uniref:FtsX-like permease family protein n=1 Tax=Paenibacillus sp. SYP-B4298 TaxID=2996034 RepID=UPI0022DE813B|nr:ABC transporter permease [Paenibacillus sp. SYP-B4298]
MYIKIIRNELTKNKLITLTITVFVAAAALLVSLAAVVAIHLFGAVDTLMTQAKTPHFLQMHSGTVDRTRLDSFAAENSLVDQLQVVEFLNVDNARLFIDGRSLAGNVQDNGFTVQNEHFDYLLDLDGKAIEVADGEIYVPITYWKEGLANIGDHVTFNDQVWTVAGFLRDSQMNSLLASSKRFLISRNDYATLAGAGSTEYLIEFRLKDTSMLGAFATSYASAGLEANGPTLTYPLFRMLNAMADGMVVGVLLLVSMLVVAIALMCIRFALIAKIEEDYRELGVMKAIGLRVSDMKRIYVVQYAAMAAVGSGVGWGLSFVFKGSLLENIRLYMGESGQPFLAWLCGVLGVLLVYMAVVLYVGGVLRRFRSLSVAEALRFGHSQQAFAGARLFSLSRFGKLGANLFLGIKDVLARKRLYVTMLVVLILASFIAIVPQNVYSTISSKSFSTYLGVGEYDLRIDIQQASDLIGTAAEIAETMKNDPSVARYAVLTTKAFTARTEDGTGERILVELGDHSMFPLHYSKGSAPVGEREIALSALNAEALGKQVGDALVLTASGKDRTLTVSGIYSDVTNGGKTAKAAFVDEAAARVWAVVYVKLAQPSLAAAKAAEYGSRFGQAKVSDVEHYIVQTFGSTIHAAGLAANAALAVALLITLLVALLFIRLLVAKDRYSIAVMKAIGFTHLDIRLQYAVRSAFVVLIGILVGTMLAGTLGEKLAGLVIAQLGASAFHFETQLLSAYVLSPLMMLGSVMVATLIGTSSVRSIKIGEHIKE